MLDYSLQKPVIFDYREWEISSRLGKEKVLRPMMIVRIGRQKIEMPALIDSGSDKTLSYLSPFGHLLGVSADDFEGEPEMISGLFGSGTAWASHIDIWIGDFRLNVPIYWLTKPFDGTSNYQLIIGRKIIFDNFDMSEISVCTPRASARGQMR